MSARARARYIAGVARTRARTRDAPPRAPPPAATHPSRRLVPAEVEGLELHVADDELLRARVERRRVLHHLVVREHVQHRRLARIVKAQEEDLGVLLEEACARAARGRERGECGRGVEGP